VQINRLEAIARDAVGVAARDLSCVDDIVKSGLWAWRNVPRSVFRWAWTSRGGLLFALVLHAILAFLLASRLVQSPHCVGQRKLEASQHSFLACAIFLWHERLVYWLFV
jgi:hypothetical protein